MADLNLDPFFFDHIKTKRLILLLGRGSEVLPIRLWAFCAKTRADNGKLTGYTLEEVESIVLDWVGKKGEAVSALCKVGFLEKCSDGFIAHDYAETQGHIAAIRESNSNAAKERWRRYREKKARDAPAMQMHSECNAPTNHTNQPTNKGELRKAAIKKALAEIPDAKT